MCIVFCTTYAWLGIRKYKLIGCIVVIKVGEHVKGPGVVIDWIKERSFECSTNYHKIGGYNRPNIIYIYRPNPKMDNLSNTQLWVDCCGLFLTHATVFV